MSYRSRFGKRMGVGGLAAAAVAAVVLGACGSVAPASAPTQQPATDAFRSLGSQSGVELNISLGVTGNQLQQMAAKNGHSRLTPATASDLAAASIVVDLNTGNGKSLNNQTSAQANGQFDLAVHVGTAPAPVELRYVNQTFYLRADLAGLQKDLNQSPSSASGFQHAVESPTVNNYVPGLAALGQGGWVSVRASDLTGILQGLQSAIPGIAGASTPSASEQQMWSQLSNAFSANASWVKVGIQGDRTHYRATLAVKPLVQDLEQSLPASLGSIPGASSVGKQINAAIGKIGNRKLVADVWVSNGTVQEISVDLNQFDHRFGFPVPVRIQVSPGATVQQPAPATPLDLSKVGGLLGGMLRGGSPA